MCRGIVVGSVVVFGSDVYCGFLGCGYFLSISVPISARLFIYYPIRYSCHKNTLVNNLGEIRIFFCQAQGKAKRI